MNIFLTIDDNYTKYLAVTIASILYNLDKDDTVNFFILDGGISEYNKKRINNLKKIKDFNIEYIVIDRSKFDKIVSSSQAHISNETNYRFIISSLKPELDKCLFLDADLIIDGNIKELYNTNIDDYYIAAVPDQAPLDTFSWTHKLSLPANYRYVNTGVILVNLKKWREDNIEEKLFKNVFKYSDILMFPDQDTLNITLNSKVKYLSHKYNAMPVQNYVIQEEQKEAFNNPVIIHWAGFMKPWIYVDANYSDYFWKYAKMTDFYEDIIYKNANVLYINYLHSIIGVKKDWNIADLIFSIKYRGVYKIITILGIKISLRQDKTRQDKTRQDKTRQDISKYYVLYISIILYIKIYVNLNYKIKDHTLLNYNRGGLFLL